MLRIKVVNRIKVLEVVNALRLGGAEKTLQIFGKYLSSGATVGPLVPRVWLSQVS